MTHPLPSPRHHKPSGGRLSRTRCARAAQVTNTAKLRRVGTTPHLMSVGAAARLSDDEIKLKQESWDKTTAERKRDWRVAW